MKGWQIFWHSVRQLYGNWQAVLLISVLPTALCVAALFALNLKFLLVPYQLGLALQRGLMPWGKIAALLVVLQVAFIWVAVNWHRFVLRDDRIGRGIPPLHLGRIWAYFLATLLISIVVFALAAFQGALVGVVLGVSKHGGTVALLIGLAIIAIPFLMLGAVSWRAGIFLPGVALGERVRMRDGWEASRQQLVPLTLLAFCQLAAFFALGATLGIKALYPTTSVGFAWAILRIWFQTMLGLSVLTTLYGHYIEKRALV